MATSCPWDISVCTVDTCSLDCAQIRFLPSLGGNAAYAAIFGVLLLIQIGQGIVHRTWGFMVGMSIGLALEVVGYIGRIMLHKNPFIFGNFLLYFIPLTLGPTFITAAIYLSLSRIVVVYGTRISRFSPRTYSILFMCWDFVALVLQGTGGGLAGTANTRDAVNTGRYVMIAGMVFQVLSLSCFIILWLEFMFRVRKADDSLKDERFAKLRESSRRFRFFKYALWIATGLILVRSVYRIVELQGGFQGPTASHEVSFMILEGPMIFIATIAMTLSHPGYGFDGAWHTAGWSLRGRKDVEVSEAGVEEVRMKNGSQTS